MPDWANPEPYDGYPEPHDTAINAVLNDTIRQLQAWVTAAYAATRKPPRERAVDLAKTLVDAAEKLTEYAETLTPDQP
jgi:hypothetical protein